MEKVETTLPSQELNSRERLDNLVEFSDWGRAWHVDASGVTLLDCGAVGRSGTSHDWTVPTSDGSNHFPWPPSHRATEHPFQPWSWLSALHLDKDLWYLFKHRHELTEPTSQDAILWCGCNSRLRFRSLYSDCHIIAPIRRIAASFRTWQKWN